MMDILIMIFKIGVIFLISIIGFYFGLLLPLAKKRDYNTLSSTSNLSLSGEDISAEELVRLYKPIILQTRSLRGPEPTKVFYELIPPFESYLHVIYRIVWPDEKHPNLIIHWLYRIFRRFYFGSIKDIEIVQLKINLKTGEIEEIKYETDSSNDPDVFRSDHAVAKLVKNSGTEKSYKSYLNEKQMQDIQIDFKEKKPCIPVLTWNHVFTFTPPREEPYLEYDLPIEELPKEFFRKYRFDRRSCLDFGINVDKSLPLKIGVISFLLTAIFSSLFLFLAF